MKLRDIAGMRSRQCYKAMYEWNCKSINGAKRSRRGGIPCEGEKPVGESETPILGELNPPKNSRILWRNQEIATKGS
jgi:hypothetical protein